MKEEKVLCVSPYYARENATFYQIYNLGVEKERSSQSVRQLQKGDLFFYYTFKKGKRVNPTLAEKCPTDKRLLLLVGLYRKNDVWRTSTR